MSARETVFPPDAEQTDKTDQTYIVDNGEFLQAVFGNARADVRPIVISFKGNPDVPAKDWTGNPWNRAQEVSTALPATANNYFSLAVFRPDDAGRFRRQKAHFDALHAVMLDDLGTKVAMERLTYRPRGCWKRRPAIIKLGSCCASR